MRNLRIWLVDPFSTWPMKSAYSAIKGFDWMLISCFVCIIQIFRICTLRSGNPYSKLRKQFFHFYEWPERKQKISFALDWQLLSFELIERVKINFNIIYARFYLSNIYNKCSRNNTFFLFLRLNISNKSYRPLKSSEKYPAITTISMDNPLKVGSISLPCVLIEDS
jgi:hypothetical protein